MTEFGGMGRKVSIAREFLTDYFGDVYPIFLFAHMAGKD